MNKTIGGLIDHLSEINAEIYFLSHRSGKKITKKNIDRIETLKKEKSEITQIINHHFAYADEKNRKKINIFYRPPFIGNYYGFKKHTHTVRLSSRIRGEQIARFLGANLIDTRAHPHETAEGVCIHVKPTGADRVKPGHFIDYLDGGSFHSFLKDKPDVKIIAGSLHSLETLRKELPNKITYIPQQHMNFERARRTRKSINTCGYIGSSSQAASRIYKKIAEELKKIDMKFITCFDFKKRQDAIDFYMKIDILVIGGWEFGDPNPHKIPTKIINAASFGIPTVAFPLAGYKEIEGLYIRANNMKELVEGVEKLRDPSYYKEFSEKIVKMAEKYHIENIAKLYRKLT